MDHALIKAIARSLLVMSIVGVGLSADAASRSREPYAPQFPDAAPFMKAIAEASRHHVQRRRFTGLTIPHHLLAADLIAHGFQMVEPEGIDKVIVLFPDHFKQSSQPFSTTRRGFETVFGRISTSEADVERLLRARGLFAESDLFARDHGIGAVLPFIRHHLPTARIVPIAVALNSVEGDWERLTSMLKSIAGPTTLIVQSTDFSHYLPVSAAVQRDQEALNVIASGDLNAAMRLQQPQHTDSRGAQYVQMRAQQEIFRAQPVVMFNVNSQAYVNRPIERTTSYIVQLYDPDTPRVGSDSPGSKVYCFAGNTIFGRDILRAIASDEATARTRQRMQQVLNGCRLTLNLTGVMVPELPVNLEHLTLAMPSAPTVEWLRSLNVVAINLANNHTMDLGHAAFGAMESMLNAAGFVVLKHGSVVDLGPFRLATLTDLDNLTRRIAGVVESTDIERIARSNAKPPLFVMLNWGPDYATTPGRRELALMDGLRDAAVNLIIGVHPHVAAPAFTLQGGGRMLGAYSLGNFLFDQGFRRSSGSVLEVRVFDQGTFFARLIPIPNFFEVATTPGARD